MGRSGGEFCAGVLSHDFVSVLHHERASCPTCKLYAGVRRDVVRCSE